MVAEFSGSGGLFRYEARQILYIPLSFRSPADELICNYKKNGIYSVKSAYHMLMHDKRNKAPGLSNVYHQKLWQKIWLSHLHPRDHNFLWRLAKNILPTKANLQKKGISLDTSCPLCEAATETAHHLFLHCEYTRSACFSSNYGLRVPLNSYLNDWISCCLEDPSSVSDQLKCTVLWHLWKARNLLVYRQKFTDPRLVAKEAMESVIEFNKFNPCIKAKPPAHNLLEVPISFEVCILQVDAGCFDEGFISFGCLLRNQAGRVVSAACKWEEMSANPVTAETLAIHWSLQLAKELKVERILVQSDALSVVNCIISLSLLTDIDHVVLNCQTFLRSFKFASVVFISRAFNCDAHNLVGLGKRLGSRTWLGLPPNCNSISVCPSVAS
ncbi:uncharacterized protein LOC131596129 [Vicia villosa]|uniref:uncharacterized protein LOC131596129 n=1 Tax=Vicia villosa TaxID=3911 RepID=UPI00273C83EF|nr:uncharacterized protein LOC131596129 [Vicia villosa]